MNSSPEGKTINVRNPRTGQHDAIFKNWTTSQLEKKCHSIRTNQPKWLAIGPNGRAEALQTWARELANQKDHIIEALINDTGRTAIAVQEFDSFISSINRWCTDGIFLLKNQKEKSKYFSSIDIIQTGTPFPLVSAISPWNFPLLLAFIDALPALMAGSGVFIKPSEVTPRFAKPIQAAIDRVPALSPILHIAAGDGEMGAALIPLTDVIAFTGSVRTGRRVAQAAAENFIPAFLELGGKDPAIVTNDTDLDRAATAILRASVVGTGQACQSLERVYVQKESSESFIEKITVLAKNTPLTVDQEGGIIGPIIFEPQAETIRSHINDALDKGAIVHCGGKIETHNGGLYVRPTVLSNVSHSMAIMTEETFGPIIPVATYDKIEDAIALANDSNFGLSAAVFAASDEKAVAIAQHLNAGGISINDAGLTTMVFEAEKNGFNLSGMGPSRMGPSGLTRFLRRKALYVNNGTPMPIQAFTEKPPK